MTVGFVRVLALSVWVSVVPTIVPLGAVTAVNALVPLPFKMPVNVAAPDPPLATFSTGPASNNESIESKSEFIFCPQESVEAPTSGFVSNRLVVVESAMFTPMRLFAKFRYYQQLQSKFHSNLKLHSMFRTGQRLVSRSLNYQRSLTSSQPCRFRLPILVLH